MSATTLAQPEIAQFASAVRAALADLSPDEIDDLTDGLEADLTERLADGDAVELGDPVAYAEELRTAAGLPRRAKQRGSMFAEIAQMPAFLASEWRGFESRHPLVARFTRFLSALRPAWWVLRALAVTAVLVWLVRPAGLPPISGSSVIIFLALTVVSVQLGRGRWFRWKAMKVIVPIGNLIVVLVLPFVWGSVSADVNNAYFTNFYGDQSTSDLTGTGLLENGNPVSNIFAYDAQGNPLSDVQLFDQDGKPLDLVGDPTMTYYNADGSDVFLVPNESVPGRLGWNVFPLTHISQSDLSDDGTVKSSATPLPAVAPFGTAKPLAGAGTSPSAAATTSPSPIPTP